MSVNCGLECPNVPDLGEGLAFVERCRYTFACLPLVHPRLRRPPADAGFTRSDLLIDTNEWGGRVVAKISPYLTLDTPVDRIRREHEDCLVQELNHCRGLGVSVAVIALRHGTNSNLARIVADHLNNGHATLGVWVQVPVEDPLARAFGAQFDDDFNGDDSDTWRWWSDFHKTTEWDKRVSLALKLTSDLPSQDRLTRWLGEPIKCLVLPTDVFLTNRKMHPVLSKPHQAFVRQLMSRDAQIMVTGASRHQDITHYVKYLQYLWINNSSDDAMDNYAKGWEDYLQTPLQPLSDNLDSYTYNVFEKDPVKYDYYQNAILDALKTRYNFPVECTCGKPKRSDQIESNVVSVVTDSQEVNDVQNVQNTITVEDYCECKHSSMVMVLGAGRGPLVRATLNAAEMANVNVKIYAVEKNPTAVVTLMGQQREMWGDKVTVIASDMRKFKPAELADIIVSELLGSFGDNELSPECLDGARHLLKEDGISIPSSYTSFLSPVMCSRLWSYAKANEIIQVKNTTVHPLETPWVVYQQNKYEIAPAKELFTFNHPCEIGDGSNVERRRWKSLQFPVSQACTLHGFSGYFSCVLFGDHLLSIVPETHTPSMISWFPIYFPIKSPISLVGGQTIEVNFWRCNDARKVWYEWNIVSPELQAIHNSCGRSSNMLL